MKRDSIEIECPGSLNDVFCIPIQNADFGGQYASVYFMRLERLRADVLKKCQATFGGISVDNKRMKYVPRVLNVRQGDPCWIIGTIYREMKYKPNVLEDVSKSHYGAPPIHHDRYVSHENDNVDKVLLEDESGRIQLTGDVIQSELLVTGCIVGVLGVEVEAGVFEVQDIRYAGYAPNKYPLLPEIKADNSKKHYIALVSGLNLNSSSGYDANLLTEYLCGELDTADNDLVSQISAVIVAGDSLDAEREPTKEKKARYLYDPTRFTEQPIHQLDKILTELAKTMPVHLMPGCLDPVSINMPQQPFHPALFAQSRPLVNQKMINLTTNPYWWEIDGKVRILGTSGQPLSDMQKYLYNDDRLKSLDAMLQWRHCAPTAPDTLWSYPFKEDDPFLLDETPNVFFAGNQDRFETCVVSSPDKSISCRLICIPKFSKTGQIVLLDVNTLKTELITLTITDN